MGINIPTREELIANKLDNIKLATHAGNHLNILLFLSSEMKVD